MGEQSKYKDRVVLYRYIISYMFILIMPVIILVFSFRYMGFKTLEREVLKKDITTLKAATYNLERVLDTCRSITMQITYTYKPFELNLDIVSAMELVQALEKYNIINDIYEDIFVIFHEAEYSYSSTSSIKTTDFYNKYSPNDLKSEDYKIMLQNIKQPTLIRDIIDQGEDYTLYTFPYFYHGELVGNVIFKMKNTHLNAILGAESKDIKREDYLVTKQELESCYQEINKQFQLNMETEEIKNDIKQLLKSNNLIEEKTYIIKSIQGKSLFISYMPEFNIAYMSVTSNDEILKSLSILKITMFSIIGIILVVGMGFVIWIARNNYRPIQQLKYLTKPYRIKINQKDYKDEIDLIKETIGYLSKQNERLEYEFEKNIPIKQNFLLNQLINGTIGDKEVFSQECMNVGLTLTAPYHSILLVKEDKEISSELEVLSRIQKCMKDIVQINYAYVIQILKNNIFTLLIGISEQQDLKQCLLKKQRLKIAIGTIESDIYYMPNAYIRARSIFELSETEQQNFVAWDQIEEYIGATRC